jgi:L-ribulose-5-phosphate 3-epimerase
MFMSRRDFVKQAAIASAAVPAAAQAAGQVPAQVQPAQGQPGQGQQGQGQRRAQGPVQTSETLHPVPLRVGMTDWNLGQRGDISKVVLAREIGLDGIQVSVQYPTDGSPTLRDPKTQAAYKRAALDNGIQICSLAIGSPGPARLPLHTNPAAAILLTEAVEIAHNLGTNNILLPILGNSHIDMTDQAQVDTFVAMMKEVARYAERYEVVVGLEDWISAEDNIRLLDAIGSDFVAVYYDPHNIARRVTDIYAEPKMLGDRIHQIHVKNADMLMSEPGGRIDWPRMAQEFHDIGYRGWYVLETGSPTKDIVADTRANIAYVKQTFRIPPPAAS